MKKILTGAYLALVSRQILILIYFFKYGTIETHARAFLTLNIFAIGRVSRAVSTSNLVESSAETQ